MNNFTTEKFKSIHDTFTARFVKLIDTKPADIELRVYECDLELTLS